MYCISCQDDHHIARLTDNNADPKAQAYLTLKNLLSEKKYELSKSNEWHWADGDFALLRVHLSPISSVGLGKKILINRKGQIIRRKDAVSNYWDEHYNRFGSQHPDLYKALLELSDNGTIQVGVWFDPQLTSTININKILYTNIEDDIHQIHPPIVFSTLTKSQIHKLAWEPWVRSIELNNTSLSPASSGTRGASDYTNSDDAFNSIGIFAENINIGIFDSLSDGCAIESDHEAFDFATINYSRPLESCIITNFQNRSCIDSRDCDFGQCVEGKCFENSCDGRCAAGMENLLTIDSIPECIHISNTNVNNETAGRFCVTPAAHVSKVSSRISEGQDNKPNHASKANLWMMNDTFSQNAWNYWRDTFIDSLIYLKDRNVHIINESWTEAIAVNSTYTAIDHSRDWFSRNEKVLFIKAGGQSETLYGAESSTISCNSLNALCVSQTGTPSWPPKDFSDDYPINTSWWLNPKSPLTKERKDAERPDIVTEGYQAKTLTTLTTDIWDFNSAGTSFAAPAIAGLAALMADYCGYGNNIDPVRMRARMRAAAWVPQAFEYQYYASLNPPFFPRWNDGIDSRVGAGLVDATRLKRFCDPPGTNYEDGQPADGSFDGTGWKPLNQSNWSWVYTADSDEDSVIRSKNTLSQALVEDKGDLDVVELYTIQNVDEGSRVRFNFSYETCPDVLSSPNYNDYSAPAIDYDLAICSNDPTWCVTSESFDDTNEGFDIITPESFKSLSVLLFRPQGTLGCNNLPEPGFWAAYLWLNQKGGQ